MRSNVRLVVGYVKTGVTQQLHHVAVVLAQVVVLAACSVKTWTRKVRIVAEAVDKRHVVFFRSDHGVKVAKESLVVALLAGRVRFHRL